MNRNPTLRALGRLGRLLGRINGEVSDRIIPTFNRSYHDDGKQRLRSLLEPVPPGSLLPFQAAIKEQAGRAMEHTFDLLGSGPVQVKRGMVCPGLEGISFGAEKAVGLPIWGSINRNGAESERIAGMVAPGYQPIDWHIDFKSGFRWNPNRWYKSIRSLPARGADIKVPWELGRMQHLASLVWGFTLARSGHPGMGPAAAYQAEFRDQILDFIGNNPPRFGVQWNCAMEAAIRVSNWLICHDLIKAAGALFDDGFDRVFLESVHAHGRFIRGNLERYGEERNNHYLANLVGLACCAAYLPFGRESIAWGEFAQAELECEIGYQFNEDGTNFEGSTAYHCLSAEMAAYGLALSMRFQADRSAGGSDVRTPEPAYALEKMAEFIIAITKDDGSIPQIGDNDSGCFLNLTPRAEHSDSGTDAAGCGLDKRFVVAALDGLAGREDFVRFTGDAWLERRIIRQLAGQGRTGSPVRTADIAPPAGDRSAFEAYFSGPSGGDRRVMEFEAPAPGGVRTTSFKVFDGFGLYVYRGGNYFMAVRCGPAVSKGGRGHFHNDQLGLELVLDGKELATDPGTFVYTPLPEKRNEYRSNAAHFIPFAFAGMEQESLSSGLFRLGHASRSECLFAGADGFLGKCSTGSSEVWRGIRILDDRILIKDELRGTFAAGNLARRELAWTGVPVAMGYGRRSPSRRTIDFRSMARSGKGTDGSD